MRITIKKYVYGLLLLPCVLAASAHSEASFAIRIGDENHDRWEHREYRDSRNYYGDYCGPRAYPRHPYYRSYVVAPLVVAPAPYYAGYPYPVTPIPARTGNYGQDVSDFRSRMTTLSKLLNRQKQAGTLSSDQVERFIQELNSIDREARDRSYNNGGNLTDNDLDDLSHRVEEARNDIETALAQ